MVRPPPGDRQARQPAKPINFGCLYGGGSEQLRITARITA